MVMFYHSWPGETFVTLRGYILSMKMCKCPLPIELCVVCC